MKAVLYILLVLWKVQAQCPTGFVDVSADSTRRCVSVSQAIAGDVSFAVARFLCQSLNSSSDLITLRSSDVLTNDASFEFSQSYYVGMTDSYSTGTSVNVHDCSDYNTQTQPQMSSVACTGACDCWAYNAQHGQLDKQNCLTDTNRFICGIFDDFPVSSCPSGWTFIRDRCYRYYVGNSAANFDEAQAVCEAEAGNLARANFYDCNYAAILAGRPDTSRNYLVGLRGDGSAGSEQWRDGTTPSEIFRITGTGDCFLLGDNSVFGQLKPTDCSIRPNNFICEMMDTEPPVILGCPVDQTITIELGRPTGRAFWTPPTAIDVSGVANVVVETHSPGDEFPISKTTVTYVFEDGNGNSALCSFVITVGAVDTQPPIITGCPDDQTVIIEWGRLTGRAFWIPPSATDISGVANLVAESHSPGDEFSITSTTVTYLFEDGSGNIAGCSFVITIQTDPLPTDGMSCPRRAIIVESQSNSSFVEWKTPIIHYTNTGETIVLKQVSPLGSGLFFPVGATEVVYSSDEALCRFWVIVIGKEESPVDITPPILYDCPEGPLTYHIRRDQISIKPNWKEPFAIDDSGLPVVRQSSHSSGDPLQVGDTNVVFNFTDFADNLVQCMFTISVVEIDETVPSPEILFCPTSIRYNLAAFVDQANITWSEPVIHNMISAHQTHSPGDSFKIGSTEIVYTANNSAGAIAACTFRVDVIDVIPPRISLCQLDKSVRACRGSTTVVWLEPFAEENSGFPVKQTQSHFPRASVFKEGITSVNYTFTDTFGNVAVCSFNITVHRNSCGVITQEILNISIYIALGLLTFVFAILTALNIYMYKQSAPTDDRDENGLHLYELTAT